MKMSRLSFGLVVVVFLVAIGLAVAGCTSPYSLKGIGKLESQTIMFANPGGRRWGLR